MRHTRPLLAAIVTLLLAGCEGFAPEACTTDIKPGIAVEIRDATTGAFIAQQATAFATEGSFRDSLRLRGGTMVDGQFVGTTKAGVDERAGMYTLEITAPGYAPWVRTGIRVRDAECHVRTVSLVALLQPTQR